MQTAGALVSVEEYLSTTYEPDMDYVDGVLEERNVGERDLGDLQAEILLFFKAKNRQPNVHAFIEQRLKVSDTRYRIPDICVVYGPRPKEQIFTCPPFIAIEILSDSDRMARMQRRIDDYLSFGVRYVWVIDPASRRAWAYTNDGSREAKHGVLRTESPVIELPLPEIFAAIDAENAG